MSFLVVFAILNFSDNAYWVIYWGAGIGSTDSRDETIGFPFAYRLYWRGPGLYAYPQVPAILLSALINFLIAVAGAGLGYFGTGQLADRFAPRMPTIEAETPKPSFQLSLRVLVIAFFLIATLMSYFIPSWIQTTQEMHQSNRKLKVSILAAKICLHKKFFKSYPPDLYSLVSKPCPWGDGNCLERTLVHPDDPKLNDPYVYLKGWDDPKVPVLLVYENPPPKLLGDGRWVSYSDGTTKKLPEEEFQKELQAMIAIARNQGVELEHIPIDNEYIRKHAGEAADSDFDLATPNLRID